MQISYPVLESQRLLRVFGPCDLGSLDCGCLNPWVLWVLGSLLRFVIPLIDSTLLRRDELIHAQELGSLVEDLLWLSKRVLESQPKHPVCSCTLHLFGAVLKGLRLATLFLLQKFQNCKNRNNCNNWTNCKKCKTYKKSKKIQTLQKLQKNQKCKNCKHCKNAEAREPSRGSPVTF